MIFFTVSPRMSKGYKFTYKKSQQHCGWYYEAAVYVQHKLAGSFDLSVMYIRLLSHLRPDSVRCSAAPGVHTSGPSRPTGEWCPRIHVRLYHCHHDSVPWNKQQQRTWFQMLIYWCDNMWTNTGSELFVLPWYWLEEHISMLMISWILVFGMAKEKVTPVVSL